MANDALAQRLAVARESGGFRPEVIEALRAHLSQAPDEQVFRMSPLRYAASAGLTENEAISLFLHATRAGVLDFTWGVLCGACGAFLTTAPALRSLTGTRVCTMCEIDAPVSDDSVEVGFTLSPAIRRLRFLDPETLDMLRDWKTIFFSPSRIMPPHLEEMLQGIVVETRTLRSGEEVTLQQQLSGKRFALFVPAHHAWAHVDVREDASDSHRSFDLLDGKFVPSRVSMRPGPATLEVSNRSATSAVMAFVHNLVPPPEERKGLFPVLSLRPYLTGKRLVTHQTFRDLFRAESIPSEGGLEFKSLTLLFTDLKGSTEMYERIGDFRAYSLVRQHFQLLREIIASRGGSMVKTIGDAVMASFAEAAPALAAAAEMNRQIQQVGEGKELQLKIGLHAGPCIAVESNERLDYFGQTVNIAARVQGVAAANEIVITEQVLGAPGAREVIAAAALRSRPDRALLKGVDGEFTLYRLQ